MMRSFFLLALILTTGACASSSGYDQTLFTYDGVDYSREQLPQNMRQRLFNAEVAYYQETTRIMRESVIDLYLSEKAKEQGKTLDQIKSQIFASEEPTEEDKKKFYEEIKDKLPYSYEIIKHELGALIVEKQVQEKEQQLLAEIEKQKGVSVFVTAPTPPKVKLDTEPYPTKGSGTAKVELVEFGDFSCPNCKMAVGVVDELLKKYEGQITFTWRYYFIHSGGASVRLAKGGHCAAQQNKFWEYYKYVFDNQSRLRWKSPTAFADELGLDKSAYESCYQDPDTEKFVKNSDDSGRELGVESTPTFFVNGKRVVFGTGFQGLESAIQEAL